MFLVTVLLSCSTLSGAFVYVTVSSITVLFGVTSPAPAEDLSAV